MVLAAQRLDARGVVDVGDRRDVAARLPESKNSDASSRSTVGANGRNDSRYLILRLIVVWVSGFRASPRIERAPSARGPNSIRPLKCPTTRPSSMHSARTAERVPFAMVS
jgi:hypothetical protein